MILTLTDKNGIKFDIDDSWIEEIHGTISGTRLILKTGEAILCREHQSTVLKMIVSAKFGGI